MALKILNTIGLFFVLLAVTPVFAETIHLKNGKTVEGKIIEKTKEYIKLDVDGITLTYYSDQIAADNPQDTSSQKPQAESSHQKKSFLKYQITQKYLIKAISDTIFMKLSIAVPRNEIAHAEISNIKIFPNPNTTFKDTDGNDIVVYYDSLLKAGTTFIAGFTYDIKLDATPLNIKAETVPDNYPPLDASIKKYLLKEGVIDPDELPIKEEAATLTANIKNPYLKAKAIYDFITDNFVYDKELLSQFQSNPNAYRSYSPQDTLARKKGICYDFAKLFVALSRSSGVPARVVRGVAFDLRKDENHAVEDLGHAWVEIYLPSYGWLPVDPTFGLTEKDKFFCFNYKSHIPQQYGLSETKEFGSLEKGWQIQYSVRSESSGPTANVLMQTELTKSE